MTKLIWTKKEKELMDNLKYEIGFLFYEKPKNSFEHIWNCAIEEALNCFYGYGEEDEI